jgi:hypothetical protein
MLLRPFQNQHQRTARHLSRDDLQGPDVYDRFMFSIHHMEMRRRMVAEKHLNDDAIKRRNNRHITSFCVAASARTALMIVNIHPHQPAAAKPAIKLTPKTT